MKVILFCAIVALFHTTDAQKRSQCIGSQGLPADRFTKLCCERLGYGCAGQYGHKCEACFTSLDYVTDRFRQCCVGLGNPTIRTFDPVEPVGTPPGPAPFPHIPTAQDFPIPNIPHGQIPQFPQGIIPQFPQGEPGQIPQFPQGVIPQFPQGEHGPIPTFPQGVIPEFPQGEHGAIPQFPQGIIPQLPQGEHGHIPNFPQGVIPQFPQGEQGAIPQFPQGIPNFIPHGGHAPGAPY